MKAVLLDAASLDDDVDLNPIRETVSELACYPASQVQQIVERLSGADIAITNKIVLNADTLKALPKLKLICLLATGTDNVDTGTAAQLGVSVRNVTAYGTASVAQHTLMLMLALANRLPLYQRDVAAGRWQASERFCLMDHKTLQLADKHLVIVGQGELGTKVAELGRSFGMKVSFAARPGSTGDPRPTLSGLVPHADALSLHCPLTDATRHLIDKPLLAEFKPGCLLINCARGGIVDDEAALEALRNGQLGGLGVDVLPSEPPRAGHILLSALSEPLNLILTPHNAWISPEARQMVVDKTAANIRDFLEN